MILDRQFFVCFPQASPSTVEGERTIFPRKRGVSYKRRDDARRPRKSRKDQASTNDLVSTRDRVSTIDHVSDRDSESAIDRVSEKSLRTTKRVRGPPESQRTIKESLRTIKEYMDYKRQDQRVNAGNKSSGCWLSTTMLTKESPADAGRWLTRMLTTK